MKKVLFSLIVIGCFVCLSFVVDKTEDKFISIADPVYSTLVDLGDTTVPKHTVRDDVFSSGKLGWLLVHKGQGAVGEYKSKRQSKQFVCTSCHNTVQESELFYQDAASKVDFSKRFEVPYTQGTTFWGIVNRSSFYNGDYGKKYGDLVNEARHDLRKAIQVCAVQCSQGRKLVDWEVESILAYFWEIQLKIGDLGVTNKQIDDTPREELADLLKSKYSEGAPATFMKAEEEEVVKELVGDPEKGAIIYDEGCLHCHLGKRYSYFKLDKSSKTLKLLEQMLYSGKKQDVHFISREGTHPTDKKKSYMPNYTMEKMGSQEIADLVAYIKQQAAE